MKLYFITGGMLYGGTMYGIDTERRTWAKTDGKNKDVSNRHAFIAISSDGAHTLEREIDFNGWDYDSGLDGDKIGADGNEAGKVEA